MWRAREGRGGRSLRWALSAAPDALDPKPASLKEDFHHVKSQPISPACFASQYRTVLVPVVKSPGIPKKAISSFSFIYLVPDPGNPEIQRPVLLEITPSPEMIYEALPGSNNEMNVLGIVLFSATVGTWSLLGTGQPSHLWGPLGGRKGAAPSSYPPPKEGPWAPCLNIKCKKLPKSS